MNTLERRYRRVLRLLPASYRDVWADEMVATFLDRVAAEDSRDAEDADYLAEYGRPGWSEVASVAALSLRLRLGTAGAPPRYQAWGAAIRLAVLATLLVNATLALFVALSQLWAAGRLPALPAPPDVRGFTAPTGWHAVLQVGYVLWVAAFVALVLGNRPAAATFVVSLLAVDVAFLVRDQVLYSGGIPASSLLFLVVDLLVLAGLAAFHRDAPPPGRRAWLTALAVGGVPAAGLLFVLMLAEPFVPIVDWPGLCCLAVVGAALVHLSGRGMDSPTWSHALTLLATAALAARLVTAGDYLNRQFLEYAPVLVPVIVVQTALVMAVGAPLVARTARLLRQLPVEPAGGTSWSG